MRFLSSLGHITAIAALVITSANSVVGQQRPGELPGIHNPYLAPVPDRLPDDYVNGRPYWRPAPGTRSVPAAVVSPAPRSVPSAAAAAPAARAPSVTPAAAGTPAAGPGSVRPAAAVTSAPVAAVQRTGPTELVPPMEAMAADLSVAARPAAPFVQTPGFVGYPLWEAEFGGRYFASTGKTHIDLFAPGFIGESTPLISRLTYRDLTAHSGEVFGRVEHATGFFLKGFGGWGRVTSGTLQDEDFPPGIFPYSSTISEQRGGTLAYGTLDLGWAWRGQDFKLGFFTGYHHYFERLNAFGCTQTAFNPFICPPGDVTPGTQVIRQETNWDALRLGVNAVWSITDRLKLTTDLAWLPYVNLSARDTHLLRSDLSGPIVQNGFEALSSVQLEGVLSYNLTPAFAVGVGARYWNIHVAPRHATFTFETAFGEIPEPATFLTQRWGAFVQASYQLGDLRPSGLPSSKW